MVQIRPGGRVCAWSRHGASLTEPLSELLAPLAALGAGWVFDGELIALNDHDGRPSRILLRSAAPCSAATVTPRRGCTTSRLTCSPPAMPATSNRHHGGGAPRSLPTSSPPRSGLRVMSALPATSDTHARLVAMGFEGTVLKRQSGSYRPGRTSSWRKLKARHQVAATIAGVHEDRDGRIWARCRLEAGAAARSGQTRPRRCRSTGDGRVLTYRRRRQLARSATAPPAAAGEQRSGCCVVPGTEARFRKRQTTGGRPSPRVHRRPTVMCAA